MSCSSPLHILEELLDAFSALEESDGDQDLASSDEELLNLSFASTEGFQGKRTMRLHGLVNH